MARRTDLLLHEAVLLLALRDDTGTIPMSTPMLPALGAALVGELLLSGRLVAKKARFSPLLEVCSRQQTGEPLLDELLERMVTAKRRASVSTWVSRAASTRRLRERVLQRLCMQGIVRSEERQVLLVFRRTVYPQVDPVPERRLIEQLRAAALGEGAVDPYTAMLLAIVRHASLLQVVLAKPERKAVRKLLAGLAGAFPESKLIDDAVRAVTESGAAAATIAST